MNKMKPAAGQEAGEKKHSQKKHPCSDCSFCQWCGDDRCRLCRESRPAAGRRLSLAEQIALYEAVNSGAVRQGEEGGDSAADDEVP